LSEKYIYSYIEFTLNYYESSFPKF